MPDDDTKSISTLIVTTILIGIVWAFSSLKGYGLTNKYVMGILFITIAFVRPYLEYQLSQKVEGIRGMLNLFAFVKLYLLWVIFTTDNTSMHISIIVILIILDSLPAIPGVYRMLSSLHIGNWFSHEGEIQFGELLVIAFILDALRYISFSYFPNYYFLGFLLLLTFVTLSKKMGSTAIIPIGFCIFFPGFPYVILTLFVVVLFLGEIVYKRVITKSSGGSRVMYGINFVSSQAWTIGKVLLIIGAFALIVGIFLGPQIAAFIASGEWALQGQLILQKAKNIGPFIDEQFKRFIDRTQKAALGDYYLGQVDQNEEKKLGVFIDEFKPAQGSFYLDDDPEGTEPIVVSGLISGASIESEDCEKYMDYLSLGEGLYSSETECLDSQIITLQCSVKDTRIKGTTTPDEIDMYSIEGSSEGFDCEIPKEKFKRESSSKSIEVRARFPFTTKSYYKLYFIDANRKRDLQKANIDVLKYYTIKETNPVAVYTNGPIMIGMGVKQDLPLAVGDERKPTRLGITIENKWNYGKINEVNGLWIIPPDGIDIECPGFDDGSAPSGEYALQLQDRLIKQLKTEITSSMTYNCRMIPHPAILDETPITTKYFKVTLTYEYEITSETIIALKEGDGIPLDSADCSSYCRDKDGCFCPDAECKKPELKVQSDYNCDGDYKTEDSELQESLSKCDNFKSCSDYDSFGSGTYKGEEQRKSAETACLRDSCQIGCQWKEGQCIFAKKENAQEAPTE